MEQAPNKLMSSTKLNTSKCSSIVHVPKTILPGYENRMRSFVVWSLSEESYIEHRSNYDKEMKKKLSFGDALKLKIKHSLLYNFMGDFHCRINTNNYLELMEMTLWDLEKFGSDKEVFEYNKLNDVTDSIENIIKKSAKFKTKLDLDWLKKHAQLLRLVNYQVTWVDSSLKELESVQFLNLSLNYLKNIKGITLSPKLQMLELHGNFIRNVLPITHNAPKTLSYLGLGRNLITDQNNGLYSLQMTNINVLDLSDNDILYLCQILSTLTHVKTLSSLSLEGNPCSFCQVYKDIVLSYFPALLYLDGIEIQEVDRQVPNNFMETTEENILTSGIFVFSCYRVMSLPPPVNDKSVIQMYYLELTVPLLDNILKEFVKYNNYSFMHLAENKIALPTPTPQQYNNSKEIISEIQVVTSQSIRKNPMEKENDESTQTVPIQLSDKCSFDDKPYPMEPETESLPKQVSSASIFISPSIEFEEINSKPRIKTAKQTWKRLLEFSIPSIEIPCDDLRILRDTFRSKVTVKLISAMMNSSDQKNLTKKKSIIDKKESKVSQMKGAISVSDENMISKETIALFHCHLRPPKWNETFIDFQWAKMEKKSSTSDSNPDSSEVAIARGIITVVNGNDTEASGKDAGISGKDTSKDTSSNSKDAGTKSKETDVDNSGNGVENTYSSDNGGRLYCKNLNATEAEGLKDLKYPDDSVKGKQQVGKGKKDELQEEFLEFPVEITCHIGYGVLRKQSLNDSTSFI